MKKIFIVIVVLVCFVMIGCSKEKDSDLMTGGWEVVLSNRVNDISEEELNIFNNAIKDYNKENLEVVALLGKQVVAGTNYMFLAKTDKNYKVVIIYNDLEGVSKVSKVNDFDFTRYTNVQSDGLAENLSGGWYTDVRNDTYTLEDEKIESMFENATSTLAGMEYKPLVVVGKQLVSGTNYAIVCYGNATVPDAVPGIYVLTLYNSLDGNSELVGNAYIDLATYNK